MALKSTITVPSVIEGVTQVNSNGDTIIANPVVVLNSKGEYSYNLGEYGYQVTSNTTAITGNFIGFTVLSSSAVFTSITAINGTDLATISLYQGFTLRADITAYQLTSGIVIFYKAPVYN
jgi:hypothetical protein